MISCGGPPAPRRKQRCAGPTATATVVSLDRRPARPAMRRPRFQPKPPRPAMGGNGFPRVTDPSSMESGRGEPHGAEPLAPEPTGFWRRFIFSTDHKMIGRQFLWLGLVFLAVAGTLSMLMRWQL